MMTETRREGIEERLERLERENLRLKRVGTVVLVFALALVLMGQVGSSRVISAQYFVVTDAAGKRRALLGTTDTGDPSLMLLDRDGEPRASVLVTGFGLQDASGTTRALLSLGADATPSMSLHDAEGEPTFLVRPEARRHTYLPARYSNPYVPTLAEWQALELTARDNKQRWLTSKLVGVSLSAYPMEEGLRVLVDTETQPGWAMHLGGGRFACSDREIRAAYESAARAVMESVRLSFPEVADKDVQMTFGIRGSLVGRWQNGSMSLEGE